MRVSFLKMFDKSVLKYFSENGKSVHFVFTLFVGVLFFAVPEQASAQNNLCKAPGPAKINIIPKTEKIKYDFTRSLAEVQGQAGSGKDFGANTQVRGFMEGNISFRPNVKYGGKKLGEHGNATCVWYEEFSIEIHVSPTIVIPHEVAADECMKRVVIEHEKEHVRIDRQLVNDYANLIGPKIVKAMKDRDYVGGPVPEGDGEKLAEAMGEYLYRILDKEQNEANLERILRQRALDTPEEYDRVSNACPAFAKLPRTP